MEFKGTKTNWKRVLKEKTAFYNRTNEIHFGDDGECVAEFVHNDYDALLISKAPEMLEMLINLKNELEQNKDAIFELMEHQDGWDSDFERLEGKIEKLEQLIKEATEL